MHIHTTQSETIKHWCQNFTLHIWYVVKNSSKRALLYPKLEINYFKYSVGKDFHTHTHTHVQRHFKMEIKSIFFPFYGILKVLSYGRLYLLMFCSKLVFCILELKFVVYKFFCLNKIYFRKSTSR